MIVYHTESVRLVRNDSLHNCCTIDRAQIANPLVGRRALDHASRITAKAHCDARSRFVHIVDYRS